jgi:hypothetical protein
MYAYLYDNRSMRIPVKGEGNSTHIQSKLESSRRQLGYDLA